MAADCARYRPAEGWTNVARSALPAAAPKLIVTAFSDREAESKKVVQRAREMSHSE